MSNITVTYRDGRVAQLEQVYIRGSKIRFLILPDMLKNAPMLKSMKNKNQGSGAGRGKAAILKAQGEWFLTNADKWCVHFSLFLVHPASWMLFFFFYWIISEFVVSLCSGCKRQRSWWNGKRQHFPEETIAFPFQCFYFFSCRLLEWLVCYLQSCLCKLVLEFFFFF